MTGSVLAGGTPLSMRPRSPAKAAPIVERARWATCLVLAGIVTLSGYGTLTPSDLRCHLPSSLGCPGGLWGPPSISATAGTQWFDVVAYDYGFWVTDTVSGQNDTSAWVLYEGWTVNLNVTSYPPNPGLGGVSEHGVGIYSNSLGTLIALNAPVGSWSSGSFVAPYVAESGDQVYCTVYCGPGHGSMSLSIIDIEPPPNSPQATAGANTTSGTVPLSVALTGASSGGTPPYSYSWDLGDGTAATGQNVSHTYTSPGSYVAVLTVTDAAGREGKASVDLYANAPAPLTVSAVASPTTGTAPLTVDFNASASGGSPPYLETWSFGDGSTGRGARVTHTYNATGTYLASVQVTDAQGATSSAPVQVSVASPSPLAVAATSDVASGAAWLHVNFSATVSGGTAPYSATWTFGDGSNGSGLQVSHIYEVAGLYFPTVRVTDSNGRSGSAATPSISVQGAPGSPLAVKVGVTPSTGEAPLAVNATASVSGGTGGYSVNWSFGDGSLSTGPRATHVYAVAGSFNVVATVRDSAGASATAATTVTALGLEIAVALNRSLGEVPMSVEATASVSGGAGNYAPIVWVWGDGTATQGCTNPSCDVATHTYTSASPSGAPYLVTASVTDAARNFVTSNTTVTVYPPLQGRISPTVRSALPPFSVNFSLNLSGGSGSYSAPYLWSFGNGNTTRAGGSTQETYARQGNYPVSVLVRDSLGASVEVTTTLTLTTQVAHAPGSGVVVNGSAAPPWTGVGSHAPTGLTVLGLVALGALFLLITGPTRKKKVGEHGQPRGRSRRSPGPQRRHATSSSGSTEAEGHRESSETSTSHRGSSDDERSEAGPDSTGQNGPPPSIGSPTPLHESRPNRPSGTEAGER